MSWVRYAHLDANIFMDHFEKKYIYSFLYDSLTIYFSYELVLKRNSQSVWITWIKNTVPSSLNIKYHKLASHFLIQKPFIQNNKLVTKIYSKITDCKNLFHIDSEHPKSLKDSIPYSQALRVKRICLTPNDFNHYCEEFQQAFKPELMNKHIKAVEKMVRKELLKERDNITSK